MLLSPKDSKLIIISSGLRANRNIWSFRFPKVYVYVGYCILICTVRMLTKVLGTYMN